MSPSPTPRRLRDVRLSPAATLLLAAVSAAASVLILATGGGHSNAQIAAEAALAHPPRVVEQLASSPAPTSAPDPASGSGAAGSGPSAPAGPALSDASASGAGGGSAGSGATGGTGAGSVSGGTTATGGGTATTPSTSGTPARTNVGLPAVGHVFLINLETRSESAAFAAGSPWSYLRSLRSRGTLLAGYGSLGSGPLADLLAGLSGQPPNPATAGGCRNYSAFASSAVPNHAGVVPGAGCIYPDAALSLADQVNAAGRTWGAYIEGMGANNCPVPATGSPLSTPVPGTQAGFDLAHNPFAFFGSLLDAGGCAQYDQDLAGLTRALASAAHTPTLTVLGPGACATATATASTPGTPATTTATTSAATMPTATAAPATTPVSSQPSPGGAGAATPTTAASATAPPSTPPPSTQTTTQTTTTPTAVPDGTCPAGALSGPGAEDAFLATWVPRILRSAAYRRNGVLIIALDGVGVHRGGATGALVLSRWTPHHVELRRRYSPYGLLHSVEDMLDLQPLARAATAPAFARQVLR